ncbi:MAG: T9SS C-terminal target domain-containing protein [Cytophagia bacterium]|nr:T9SS C-terminal target domain-containing protein [Cytophagia bacterium]NBW34368.1 T9SS C-terminal target domain-containing protein [Cytophagia bacterium]
MRLIVILITTFFFSIHLYGQNQQMDIARIEQMKNMPLNYSMRDWKKVTADYDALVFSTSITGQHLPLVSFKSQGFNYPEVSPVLLQTYVGTSTSNQAEAINIIPAMVGASLIGINKQNQNGINWVEKTKDFFNKTNNQNVYLNGYNTTTGNDWWYDVMPNIFFYQLYTQYPNTSDYDQQFVAVADQWLRAVKAMGGNTAPWSVPNMNYRAWNLITMTGNSQGVKEPEAAGGIAWLLYHAYQTTHNREYLYGAQQALEFLTNLNTNPSYELQLPYGAMVAAKMNAELNTQYDVEKILNWCFDRGPLRGWGSIVGTWNGRSVDGLIGEANDNGNDYAFAMNGFQQAAALAPVIRYDKRFARSLSKWLLNVANASRLFYPVSLPAASQDDYTWSNTNDPASSIAYEALKEVWEGKPLYGTGDAKRSGWAATNLALYGSSHVGYLAAIVEETNVEGILLLDLTKTDFFSNSTFPSYALYNPHNVSHQVNLDLPAGSYTIYDAITESVLATEASGSVMINIEADQVKVLTYVPAAIPLETREGKLYAGDEVVDYHYGYDYTPRMRIKALSVSKTTVEFNEEINFFATTENIPAQATYKWYVDHELISSEKTSQLNYTVPTTTGNKKLVLEITNNGNTISDSLLFTVVENIPKAPVASAILPDQKIFTLSASNVFQCVAEDDDTEVLSYQWTVNGGTLSNAQNASVTWQLPDTEGIFTITCQVTDQDMLTDEITKQILVKSMDDEIPQPLAYYPLDGNTLDYSGNGFHATSTGVTLADDVRGESDRAYLFNAGDDIILVPADNRLNVQDKITASFWVYLQSVPEEIFLLSHGSWEQRWKVSITPNNYLRWTIKTSSGTKDVDSSTPLQLGRFYHITVVYTGFSMEVYMDGLLDTFAPHTGALAQTTKSLTFGRKEEGESNYFLRGILDEVRLYHAVLSPETIQQLPDMWAPVTAINEQSSALEVFPNPAQTFFYILGASSNSSLMLLDLKGNEIAIDSKFRDDKLAITLPPLSAGIYVLKINTGVQVNIVKLLIQ